jgi:hypothetical protein
MLTKELYVVGLILANIVEETATLIVNDVKREVPRQWEKGWDRHHVAAEQAIAVLLQVGLAIAAWYTLNFVKEQPKLTGWQPTALLPAIKVAETETPNIPAQAPNISSVDKQPTLAGWQPFALLPAAKVESTTPLPAPKPKKSKDAPKLQRNKASKKLGFAPA